MNALPWYKSPVYVGIAVSIVAHLAAYFPKIAEFLGLDAGTIPVIATDVLQGIGLVALFVAERFRANSKIQPLTLTQGKADEKSNSSIPADKPPSSSGLS